MQTVRKPLGLSLVLVAALAAPASADKTFNIGSLIIPTSATYQTDCGAVATYGLVYNVLRANAWLIAQGTAVAPGGAIQIYYSVKDPKGSPNRCAASNVTTTPAPLGDARWQDGCDFEVTNAGLTPVQQVKNWATAVVNDADVVTFSTSAKTTVYPQYATETLAFPTVTTVRYGGGPFIIDQTDASTFLKLLDGTLNALDSQGNTIDFSPFRVNDGTNPTACTFGTDIGGYVRVHRAKTVFTAPTPKAFVGAPPRVALLATASGTPSDLDHLSKTIDSSGCCSGTGGAYVAGGVYRFKTTNNHNYSVGDVFVVSGVTDSYYNGTFTVGAGSSGKTIITTTGSLAHAKSGGGTAIRSGAYKNGSTIYVRTSQNHGLIVGDSVSITGANIASYNGTWTVATAATNTFTITAGVPALPAWTASTVGGTVAKGGATPTKKVDDGILQKYLKLAGLEFTGAGGCPPGGINVGNTSKCPLGGVRGQIYDTFDFGDMATKLDSNYKMVWTPHWETTSDTTTAVPQAGEVAVMQAISTFLDGQTGLMAECHSIQSFEGGYDGSTKEAQGIIETQFQTCKDTGAATCESTFTAWGLDVDPGTTLAKNTYYQNCSDPNLVAGNNCIYFSAPSDPFVQIGDFKWYTKSGSVEHFLPDQHSPKSVYRPGVLRVISAVPSLVTGGGFPGTLTSDYVTRNNKEDNPAKGNILYMSGHDVSGVVSGTKVILQTLLLLGEPPIVSVTKEVTRASPIASVVGGTGGGNVLIQGSFEHVDPPASTPTFDADADAGNFRFPDLAGHLRGYDPASITGQVDLNDAGLTVRFDAATRIPDTTNSMSGCGTDFTKDCRTIWTSVGTGINPAITVFKTSTAGTLLPYLSQTAVSGAITSTGAANMMTKIYSGFEATVGTIAPALGGIDRSTAAVVPSSLLSNASRPKMIYVGGTDGMMHAFCGEKQASGPCDEIGRELWAFVPKYQLPYLRKNLARVDGSPRAMDMYGDFTTGAGTGTRSFRTLLMFQTTYGDAAAGGREPSFVVLDVTNPSSPSVVLEKALPGQGTIVNGGRVRIGGVNKNYAFVHTNNGSVTTGNNVTTFDLETGSVAWTHAYTFNTGLRSGGATLPPVTGIPGGAVGVDRQGTGSITEVVFGSLYGDIWQVDATTGISRNGSGPVFRYSTDQHPFGVPPAIWGQIGSPHALLVSGGYADLAATGLWSASDQKAVSVEILSSAIGSPLDENSDPATTKLDYTIALDAGDKGFSQATVIGDQVFITADSDDINSTSYGSVGADTGRLYVRSVNDGSGVVAVDLRGGAGGVAVQGNPGAGTIDIYAANKDKAEAKTATIGAGDSLGSANTTKLTRMLWLRTL